MSWTDDTTTLLSFDTSTTKTGWAVFQNSIYKESGVLDWEHIKDINERSMLMMVEIIQTIERYEPSILVVEKDIVGSGKRLNMSTINVLTRLIGGIFGYVVSINMNYPFDEQPVFYVEYTPSEWRKFVGVKGRKREEYKENSIKRIKNKYNIDVDDNEADAINIGEAYILEWDEIMSQNN